MLEKIGLKNVRSFKTLKDFEFKPITVLCGTNSSGKSTILKSLLLWKQSLENLSTNRRNFVLNGKYTNLGSGYKIANMDLNIRGSGTIFGYNQSGNIENIGYELISKLIDEHIHANEFNINAVNINLINKGIIPNYYINSENIRLTIYRKIKMSYSLEELKLLEQEVNDRFGPIPEEMLRILEIQKNLILCKQLFINMIEEKNNIITIQFIRKSWEQKVTYLLNKINELIKEYEINYEVKEFKESLIIKLEKHENIDSCILTNQILNKLI